jgi:3-phosphoshikimate 1-carboxyvinyltransferase
MQGSLKSGHYSIPGSVSSQYITGLLLALPLCAGDSVIEVVEPFESKAYVDITLAVMARFGILLEEKAGAYHIRGGQSYTACDYAVEGDWSQTAAWLCAGAVNGEVTVYGMDPASKQGDAAVMDILKGFGARIEILSNGGIRASRDKLAGVLIDAAQIPDIIPVLAAVAVYARGKTKIINAGRLRYKESDRLAATAEVLSQLGADIKIDCDSLIIHGRAELQGGEASGHNDHRIVMALAVSASGCREPVTISGYGCIDKSYPHFFEDYRKLGGEAYGIDTR